MTDIGKMNSDDDIQQQEDEILALQSILGEEGLRVVSESSLVIGVPNLLITPRVDLRISFPKDYPSCSAPILELEPNPTDCISDQHETWLSELRGMFHPGDVVVFAWVSWLLDAWGDRSHVRHEVPRQEIKKTLPLPVEQPLPGNSRIHENVMNRIVHGTPITEKKSTFQAHILKSTDPSEVDAFMECLLTSRRVKAATHNILAYRIGRENAPGSFYQDFDDDGESAAGGRLLHLLQMVDARDVVVCVSRWFGGILLGPARFGLINRAAKELLESQGYIEKKKKKKNYSTIS